MKWSLTRPVREIDSVDGKWVSLDPDSHNPIVVTIDDETYHFFDLAQAQDFLRQAALARGLPVAKDNPL